MKNFSRKKPLSAKDDTQQELVTHGHLYVKSVGIWDERDPLGMKE